MLQSPTITPVKQIMSWEGGVDLVALTGAATAPNIIVHLARMVHTPQGSAPSGMVLYQPDPEAAPAVIGFVSHDSKVGGYFGPNIFADTPFEKAPVLSSVIEIESDFPRKVTSRVKVAEHLLEVEMFNFQEMTLIHRAPAAMPPFWQQGVEAIPERVTLKVNGEEVPLTLPPVGISGGHPVVWSLTVSTRARAFGDVEGRSRLREGRAWAEPRPATACGSVGRGESLIAIGGD